MWGARGRWVGRHSSDFACLLGSRRLSGTRLSLLDASSVTRRPSEKLEAPRPHRTHLGLRALPRGNKHWWQARRWCAPWWDGGDAGLWAGQDGRWGQEGRNTWVTCWDTVEGEGWVHTSEGGWGKQGGGQGSERPVRGGSLRSICRSHCGSESKCSSSRSFQYLEPL